MTTLGELVDYAHTLWPLSGAEEWDASGLVVGQPSTPVHKVLLAVDAVAATIAQAIDSSSDLLLTHHPLLLKPVNSVSEEHYKGHLISELIRHNIALLASHTNADIVENGVSDVIANKLGLHEITPILATHSPQVGIGRVGNLTTPVTLEELAESVAKILPTTAAGLRVAGDKKHMVTTVALCGGAGDSLLSEPQVMGADVYITSDLRHHPAQESRERARLFGGPALIDISHWAAESLWLETAAQQLRGQFPEIVFDVSDINTDPWDFHLTSPHEKGVSR